MSEGPPNWHFEYLAPVYDYLAFEREMDPILKGLSLKPGDRLLDLAGGTGKFLVTLIERGRIHPKQAFLLDRSREMVHQAVSKELQNVSLGDTARLPFADNAFGGVFAGDAIHHMGDPETVFKEVRRVLRPGRPVVIEEFDPGTFVGKLLYGFERLSGMGSRFREPHELRELVMNAGLVDVDVHQDGFVYVLTATAPELDVGR